MTRVYLKQIFLLIKRLLVCYLLYFIARLVFFVTNASYFGGIGFGEFLGDCFFGLRFDSFSIVVSNCIFILLSLLPFNFFYKAWFQEILLWLFAITNSVFLAANYIDVGYFPFIKKRSSMDLFYQIRGQSDMRKLIPQFINDFWWILLLFILSVFLTVWLYRKIKITNAGSYYRAELKEWLAVIFLFCISASFAVFGMRGGLQKVPIGMVNAGSVTKPERVPIVLNTPFTLIKSTSSNTLAEYYFFTPEKLKTIYTPVHHYPDLVFTKQNIIVLILESFSKEYTKLAGTKSITQFLDSLMNNSLVFTNGFANGTKSIEDIPAILSSLPSLMENPFINSMYSTNFQTSFANLLRDEGYTTAFFHGGTNGTMNFDDWASSAGYDKYFGRNEYNNDKDFDGFWGIFDEPFLQFTAAKMSGFKEPFHSAIFTLSSHHPFNIPKKYKNQFRKTNLENSESIGYADYSLRKFFEAVKKTTWYKNSLFVLTADHTSLNDHPFYFNRVGYYSIPILFFKPDNSMQGEHGKVFSQIDILPSVMNAIGYNKPFFAFGESYLSGRPGNAFSYFKDLIMFTKIQPPVIL